MICLIVLLVVVLVNNELIFPPTTFMHTIYKANCISEFSLNVFLLPYQFFNISNHILKLCIAKGVLQCNCIKYSERITFKCSFIQCYQLLVNNMLFSNFVYMVNWLWYLTLVISYLLWVSKDLALMKFHLPEIPLPLIFEELDF